MRGDKTRGNVRPSRRALLPKQPYHDYYDLVFRGYAPNDHKTRKDGESLNTFDDVSTSNDLFGVFRTGIVMVDVDDGDNAVLVKKILDACAISYLYQNTTRGMHFFFTHGRWSRLLKDKNHIMSAVGIPVDYKVYDVDGTKLCKTLEDGRVQERPILTSDNWVGSLIDLPPILVPTHSKDSLRDVRECRNDFFFNYILTLMRIGLDEDECRHVIRCINTFVLPSGLDDRELDVILRPEAFPTNNDAFIYCQNGDKRPKLDYEAFANYLIAKHHICRIDDRLYIYEDGVYVEFDSNQLNDVVMSKLKNTTKTTRSELREYVLNFAPCKTPTNYNYILFNNGVYDIVNDRLLPKTPDYVFLNKIPHKYERGAAKVAVVDEVINNLACGDPEVKRLLIEIIGYTFYRRNKMRKFFVLVGGGYNGKSTYLDMLDNLLGEPNVSRVDLQEISDDKFAVQMLTDKLVNIGDDIDKSFVAQTGKLKKLVTGETILAQKKGQDLYKLQYYGKLIFSCNDIPRINDKSDGMKSRMVIVPLKADFTKTKKIPFVDELLKEESAVEYIIKLAVDSLQELLARGVFEIPQCVVEATEAYHRDNDSVAQWLEEYGEIDQKVIKDVYLSYCVYCHEANMQPEGRTQFCRRFYAGGYTRRQVKGEDRQTKYIFEKID